jgi:hypothetical protein
MANVTVFDTGAAKYGVAIQGLAALTEISDLSAKVEIAARRAVNTTLDRTRTAGARKILAGVAFPASYLNPSEGRLSVTRYAAGPNLEGKIGARVEATSLARFIVSNSTGSRARRGAKATAGSVQVMVKPGHIKTVAGGFVIGLRHGNRGLAVRSNGPPPRAWKPKPIGHGLWLLYGPSVAQAFGEVRMDIAPEAAEFMENEFTRQMGLT